MKSACDRNMLALFLYEELGREERRALQGHLDECGDCTQELARLDEALHVYRQLPDEIPPRRAVLSSVTAGGAPVRAGLALWLRRWTVALAAVCGILLVAGLSILSMRLSLPSTTPGGGISAWTTAESESLDSLSRQLASYRKTQVPVRNPSDALSRVSMPTLDEQISSLRQQIDTLSKSVSTETF
ncbi:MAG: zf-HC2 domain-containing protein [Acidobacteriota bacterium]